MYIQHIYRLQISNLSFFFFVPLIYIYIYIIVLYKGLCYKLFVACAPEGAPILRRFQTIAVREKRGSRIYRRSWEMNIH